MSKRDPRIRLLHMLTHSQEAVNFMAGKSRADLDTDRLLNLGIVRLLEIVGEAANQVPKNVQARYPQIAWPQIIGFRNRIVHGYDRVDFDVVLEIVQDDLPPLIVTLSEILASKDK